MSKRKFVGIVLVLLACFIVDAAASGPAAEPSGPLLGCPGGPYWCDSICDYSGWCAEDPDPCKLCVRNRRSACRLRGVESM